MKALHWSLVLTLVVAGCATAPRPVGHPIAQEVRFTGEHYDLSQVDIIPRAIYQKQPIYPYAYRRAGIIGEVVVEFIVDADGAVQQAQVRQATSQEFGDAVIAAVSKWRFTPAMKDGQPVAVAMQVPITFSYSDD